MTDEQEARLRAFASQESPYNDALTVSAGLPSDVSALLDAKAQAERRCAQMQAAGLAELAQRPQKLSQGARIALLDTTLGEERARAERAEADAAAMREALEAEAERLRLAAIATLDTTENAYNDHDMAIQSYTVAKNLAALLRNVRDKERMRCPRGGKADAADLKSVVEGHAGSTPVEGTSCSNCGFPWTEEGQ